MAIVLPQGNLNNANAEPIRNWIFDKARVLAVVGIHLNTFKPFTNTKTSVLFLRKWGKDEERSDDYPIFMAVNEKPVKDGTGSYIFKRNPDSSFATDDNHRRIIDHDLDEIAEEASSSLLKNRASDFGRKVMATFSAVDLSELEGGRRLDPDYYRKGSAVEFAKQIAVTAIPLRIIAKRVTQGPNPHFTESGRPLPLNGRSIVAGRVDAWITRTSLVGKNLKNYLATTSRLAIFW